MLVVDVSELVFDVCGQSNRFVVVDETFGRAPDKKITVRFWTIHNIFKQRESINRPLKLVVGASACSTRQVNKRVGLARPFYRKPTPKCTPLVFIRHRAASGWITGRNGICQMINECRFVVSMIFSTCGWRKHIQSVDEPRGAG
jgi:hypothetical protein